MDLRTGHSRQLYSHATHRSDDWRSLMSRDLDPNNLSGRDVLSAIAPIILGFGAVYLVNRFFPDFVVLFIVLLLVLVLWGVQVTVRMIPTERLEAMARKENERTEKIKAIPVVGPFLDFFRRMLGWLSGAITVLTFLVLVYYGVKRAFF